MATRKQMLEQWAMVKDALNSACLLAKTNGIPPGETIQYLHFIKHTEYLLAWDELADLGKRYDIKDSSFWRNMALAARKMIEV